ncbi:MAG: hypothetical protein LC664_10345 [Flavobacteriales bacterium]|nr:hypothetical protein [Flavobacteriales bacterium]
MIKVMLKSLSLSLSNPKSIMCLMILLTSYAAFGQSEVKIQNKTDCEMTVTVYWTNGNQVQAQQPVSVSPVSIQTIVGPAGTVFCRMESDFTGGANPDIINYSQASAQPVAQCVATDFVGGNTCYSVVVFDGATLYVGL